MTMCRFHWHILRLTMSCTQWRASKKTRIRMNPASTEKVLIQSEYQSGGCDHFGLIVLDVSFVTCIRVSQEIMSSQDTYDLYIIVLVIALFAAHFRPPHLLKCLRHFFFRQSVTVIIPGLSHMHEPTPLSEITSPGLEPIRTWLVCPHHVRRVHDVCEMACIAEVAPPGLEVSAWSSTPWPRTSDKRSECGNDEGMQEGAGVAVRTPHC